MRQPPGPIDGHTKRLVTPTPTAGATPNRPCPHLIITFAWIGRCRRLSKDYEGMVDGSEAIFKLLMIHLMTRRPIRRLGT